MLPRRFVEVSAGKNSLKYVLLPPPLPCCGVHAQGLLEEPPLPLGKDTSLVRIWEYLAVRVTLLSLVLLSFTGSHSEAHAILKPMLTLLPLLPPMS